MIHLKHGWVDAIILRKYLKDGTLRHSVYLAQKDDVKISSEAAEKIPYPISSSARIHQVKCMYDAGKRGIRDMSSFSRKFVVQPADAVTTAKEISPDHDIIGFDHPRTDMVPGKTDAGTTIQIGGDTGVDRGSLSDMAMLVLDMNFTKDEVRRVNLYFEGSNPLPDGVGGACSTYRGDGEPVSVISVPNRHVSEDILTHEVVHALRAVDGRHVRDRDLDEIATDYESKLRTQNPMVTSGYYKYIPNVLDADGSVNTSQVYGAILDDRILATGSTKKPLKGRRLTHDVVPNTVMRSRIATAQPALRKRLAAEYPGSCQLVAEDVDTYFQIKLPDKTTSEYHIRFTKARPTLAKIRKHLKERFGKNIEAWEWQDGMKVRIISRPKKARSRKRTTKAKAPAKKRTLAKRRTPARKLVAAKRYGLDAILGVPEGFV